MIDLQIIDVCTPKTIPFCNIIKNTGISRETNSDESNFDTIDFDDLDLICFIICPCTKSRLAQRVFCLLETFLSPVKGVVVCQGEQIKTKSFQKSRRIIILKKTLSLLRWQSYSLWPQGDLKINELNIA